MGSPPLQVSLVHKEANLVREHLSHMNGILRLLPSYLLQRHLGRFTHVRYEIITPEAINTHTNSSSMNVQKD